MAVICRPVRALSLVLITIAALAGCGDSRNPVGPAPVTVGRLATPELSVRSLQSAWNRLSISGCDSLFTTDFVFTFNPRDSSGRRWSGDHPWGRAEEMASFAAMVDSEGVYYGPVIQASVYLDGTLRALPDTRPGKEDSLRHRVITVPVYLNLVTSDGHGIIFWDNCTWYLARGDAAAITGVPNGGPDTASWYVERWEDGTSSGAVGTRPQPAQNFTWGMVKTFYLPLSDAP
jgi:hypothetical protein